MVFVPKRSRNDADTGTVKGEDYHDRSESPSKKRRLSTDLASRDFYDQVLNAGQAEMSATLHAHDENWQVVKSKSSRKRNKNAHANEGGSKKPALHFQAKRQSYYNIKDLQELVLYVLADGIAPTWVALQNAKEIKQALVLMVPGLDESVLRDFTSSVSGNQDSTQRRTEDGAAAAGGRDTIAPVNDHASPIPCQHPPADAIISIKAPGDSRYSKVHSPLQAMLVSPPPATKDKRSSHVGESGRSFQNTRTRITAFVHTADELRDAEFPIHLAAFTNEVDRELEGKRRQATNQSESAGWVDTDIAQPTPAIPDRRDRKVDFTSQDLDVYALDCEMVLTTDDASSLARISVLNWHGRVVLDKYVKPSLPIKNYFTQYSGITPAKLEHVTTSLSDIQQELKKLLTPSSILLGHSLDSDLNALKMTHPFIIDTSMIYPHPRGLPLRSSLKFLASRYLKREIQLGGVNGHDSVEDARAVLDLVRQKCEKGAKWGTPEANGESIFGRLARAGRNSAIVEYGTPERGLGREATVKVGCQNDGEIVQGLIRVLGNSQHEQVDERTKTNFVWGRLRDMETALGWNSTFAQNGIGGPINKSTNVAQAQTNGQSTPSHEQTSPEDGSSVLNISPTDQHDRNSKAKIDITEARSLTLARLSQIYEALQSGTLLILYSGTGDMRPVLKLQQMQTEYRKEFKVKKWDELTVKWTDNEEQALRKAAEEARKGCGLLCIKD